MWKTIFNRAYIKKLKSLSDLSSLRNNPFVLTPYTQKGICQNRVLGHTNVGNLRNLRNPSCLGANLRFLDVGYKGYASSAAAEEIILTEEEDSDEVREMVQHLNKEIKSVEMKSSKQQRSVNGIGQGKYNALRKRQIKIETEAWENAAKEYQELLVDMCEQKLAPNLPYVKSLFLGWYAISGEQDLCKEGKNRGAYAPQFDQLPEDMMTIITMHKLMGLLMTGGGQGGARVVQAALHIGEAIEHENIPRERKGREKEEMLSQIGKIFDIASVERFEKVYSVDSHTDNQVKGSISNANNTLEITRIDWYITATNVGSSTSNLHFAEVTASNCNVYCAYSPERFIKLCRGLNLRYIPGEGELVKTYNLSNKIQIKNPLKELATRNGSILYLDGTLDKKDVFVKKVPIEVNCSRVIEVYQSCAHIENIVGLQLVEHDDRFLYMAFEKTRDALAKYLGIS